MTIENTISKKSIELPRQEIFRECIENEKRDLSQSETTLSLTKVFEETINSMSKESSKECVEEYPEIVAYNYSSYPKKKTTKSIDNSSPKIEAILCPVDPAEQLADKWFRKPSQDIPGIIIEKRQNKHSPNVSLFGPYDGGRGEQFKPEDCTASGIQNLVDYMLTDDKTTIFDRRPPQNETSTYDVFSIDVRGSQYAKKYPGIRVNALYQKEKDSWSIHYFPAKTGRK